MRLLTSLSVVLALYFMSIFSADAQTQQTNFCTGEKYQQFDFWEGDWKVYDTKGSLIGTNNIVKMQQNCVMQENWVSTTSNNRGTSYNYYNKADDTWNQLWVDNSGFVLELKGRFKEGKMVLDSQLQRSPKGNYYNRLYWQKQEDGSVLQVWERLDENKKLITEVFRGIYKKNS